MTDMQSASPTSAGIDQSTTRGATSAAFTGASFKWDWKPDANAENRFFGGMTDPLARRYRVAGHPSPTGQGPPS